MLNKPKSAALINDLCGLGRCSLGVAIPIMSALNIQTVAIPTAILSCHTGFESYSFLDFTPYLNDYLSSLDEQNYNFDSIYTGFIGSIGQFNLIKNFIKHSNASLIFIDPVMGDDGKSYATYTEEMCKQMKSLVSLADITTPNLTEACILTDTPYNESITAEEAIEIAHKITDSGAKTSIITGICDKSFVYTVVYRKSDNYSYICKTKRTKIQFAGTGDIFSSLLCALIMNDVPLEKAINKSCDFVREVTQYSEDLNTSVIDGIAFEPFLSNLKEILK